MNGLELNFKSMQQAGHCRGEKQLQHMCVGRTVQSSLDTEVELVTAKNALIVNTPREL